jgi:phosphatidylserine/phosphatidylglycerophosphate/cardiolipin synthase-like enzyme
VTIIGGRNVGDEYFGAGDGGLFADIDVLAIGPIVDAVTADFERYWHSASAYTAAQVPASSCASMVRYPPTILGSLVATALSTTRGTICRC